MVTKKILKYIWSGFAGTLLIASFFSIFTQNVYAQNDLPEEYYPNYHINEEWNALLEYFIDIEASSKVGTELQVDVFRDMHDIFEVVFEYFPQSSTNEVIYRQCLLITDDLSDGVTRAKYTTFKERCYEPLGTIIQDINTEYLVDADIEANPDDGSAPLNVTFDGRDSVDPSNDTIPSDNFFWWYKDVYGNEQPIGKGPVVNYTFDNPGNHIVHLTVRSSNNYEEGIFDGEASVEINVAPKAANMVVYINGQKANENDIVKIGTQDAEEGVLIDATATVPLGARTIEEHTRDIVGTNGVRFDDTMENEGSPGQFIYDFPRDGVYNLTLEIIDNEGNRLSQTYALSVSDPVASMDVDPEEGGTTSSEFNFSARGSYSITSRIDRYQWLITNPRGEQIESIEAKSIERNFAIPGTYTIKLTVTDEQGNSSIDTEQITVGSTPPVPGFTVKPQQERENPSQFILDASGTFDEDARAGNDELTYSWSFSNNNAVRVERQLAEDNSKIRVIMDEVGTYKVKLTVEDQYGESVSIEKEIDVKSTLRPELNIQPQVGVWGEAVTFVAQTNKPVAFYQRDFGDGESQQSKEPKVTHTYDEADDYQVTLQVITDNSERNSLTRSVFMGQKDFPVAAFQVKGAGNSILPKDDTCETPEGNIVPAFHTTRYENITLDASQSTNAQGDNTNLNISFHPRNDQVYNKSVLSYGFPEVGCTYVDLFVEDSNLGKTEQKRIWFNVVNALPTLQNLTLSFPQNRSGNPVSVGANPTQMQQQTNLFDNASIIVRVQAKAARDPDGFISHFRWYYYPSNDPLRKEGFKITPGDVPYTTFVIPKPLYATEYAFEVEMIDNNEGKISSREIVGKGPVVFFPPEEDSLDVPIVTLTVDKLTTRVGEEVTFTTESSTLSENPNFKKERYFKYDFNGDGIYDIQSTKKSEVTYSYTQAGTYKPKVSVYFKGRAGVGTTEKLTVLKGLKPQYEVETFGKTALVKDFSQGDIIHTAFCMNGDKCTLREEADAESGSTQSGTGITTTTGAFIFKYPETGRYLSTLQVTDQYSNIQTAQKYIDIEEEESDFGLLSVPAASKNTTGYSIGIAQDEVTFYPVWKGEGNCYIDINVTTDSDGDGDPLYDEDVLCNELATVPLFPNSATQRGKIYYVEDGSIKETNLLFDFFDYEEPVNDEWNRARERIDEILASIEQNSQQEGMDYYKDLLRNLKSVLGETNEMNSVIAQMLEYQEQNTLLLTEKQREEIQTLLSELSSSDIKEIYGATPYEIAKSEITTWFSGENRRTVQSYFTEFESASGNRGAMKDAIDKIYTFAAQKRREGVIDEVDFNYIKVQLCKIVEEYELPSKTCGTIANEEPDQAEEDTDDSGSILGTILRVILWVVVGLVAIFAVIVIIFAIKAKKRNKIQEPEEDEDVSGGEGS